MLPHRLMKYSITTWVNTGIQAADKNVIELSNGQFLEGGSKWFKGQRSRSEQAVEVAQASPFQFIYRFVVLKCFHLHAMLVLTY